MSARKLGLVLLTVGGVMLCSALALIALAETLLKVGQ